MKRLLPKSLNNPQGFTLVELMVVITIIAILALVGIVAYTNVQKNARDTKRKADIDAIANAIESNYNSGTQTYPTAAQGTWFTNGQVPSESQAGASAYTSTLNATGYVVCAKLENSTGNSSTNTYTYQAGGVYYCDKNQQ